MSCQTRSSRIQRSPRHCAKRGTRTARRQLTPWVRRMLERDFAIARRFSEFPSTMIALAFSMLAGSAQPGCSPDAMVAVNRAAVLAAEFDLAGASAQLEAESLGRCETAQVAIRYARGLMAAQEAFRQGGSFESLAPVRQAIAGLDAISKGRPGAAIVARLCYRPPPPPRRASSMK